MNKSEMVNHPPHYNNHPSGIECIDVVEHMSFNIGNAIKYLWRMDDKDNLIQDIDKAIWYLQREKQKREKQKREKQKRRKDEKKKIQNRNIS